MKNLLMLALLFQGADSGVITGRLLTIDGKPAAGVRVAAMTIAGPGVADNGALLSITETDANGQYRLEKVPAGRYYVTAGLVSAPSYYPGTAKATAAKEIQVLAGSMVDKVDFSMAIPDGFTVSGRLAMKPSITPTNKIGLISPATGIIKEATLQADGTFEFAKVPPGSYMMQMPVGVPSTNLTVLDRDIAGLVIGSSTGVRILGKLLMNGIGTNAVPATTVALSGTPQMSVLSVPPQGGTATGGVSFGGGPLPSTRSNSDGSFEFLSVPAGTYTLRALGIGPSVTSSLVVADKDITGLEIAVPFQAEFPGKIVMSDGSRFIPGGQGGVSVEARYANGSMGAAIAADGSFRVRITQGDFQIGLRNLALGYRVEAITFKGTDILKNPLHIEPGQQPDEIILTVAAVSLDSIKGVRFSGRVTGLPSGSYAGGKITLTGRDSSVSNVETTVKPDGTFEFAKVPPGNYMPRVEGIPNVLPGVAGPIQTVSVGNDDISGFQVPLSIRSQVTGKITVVDQDGRPRPDVMPTAQVMFRRMNGGTTGTSLSPDGTFRVPLEVGDQTFNMDRMPSQFTIQSVTSGAVDLMKSPLKIEFNVTPPEIQVRVLYKP